MSGNGTVGANRIRQQKNGIVTKIRNRNSVGKQNCSARPRGRPHTMARWKNYKIIELWLNDGLWFYIALRWVPCRRLSGERKILELWFNDNMINYDLMLFSLWLTGGHKGTPLRLCIRKLFYSPLSLLQGTQREKRRARKSWWVNRTMKNSRDWSKVPCTAESTTGAK